MKGNIELTLGVGNISSEKKLGMFYQDFTPAIYHFENRSFGDYDENNIPYINKGNERIYSIIFTMQYALICHDLALKGIEYEKNINIFKNCTNWLDKKKENFKDSIIWRNPYNEQYDLKEGWVSSMYQGQGISIYLRKYQLTNDDYWLEEAYKIFNFFKYDYVDGGVKRIDEHGCIWFEEYPTDPPSYVLNGFIYTMFGIYDLCRVTQHAEAKELWEKCIFTLEKNLSKYDVRYWSIYDQLKKQLVSHYYQKNVHVPLMEIMYLLTKKEIFKKYADKWQSNLNNRTHLIITKIMYRVLPRLNKLFKQ